MALKHPFKYRSVIRYAKGRAVKTVLAIWAFSLVFTSLTLIPGVTDEVFLIGFASFVLTVTAIIIFAYGNIFFIVRRSARWRESASYSYYAKRNKIVPCDSLKVRRTNLSKVVQKDSENMASMASTQMGSNRTKEIDVEQISDHTSKMRRVMLSGYTQFDKFRLRMTRKEAGTFPAKESRINAADIGTQSKQKLRCENTQTDAFQLSQLDWRLIKNPQSSSREKHDLKRTNTAEIDLEQGNGRKTSRKTHTGRMPLKLKRVSLADRTEKKHWQGFQRQEW
ncbi:hypothetical protein OS493_012553 [Desmophyllum pertusum]|uniref:Uncharacterized protein n=1 Tax=Desmophyllum pertusum TaxID=174260 RepID=A0A9W9ZE27_9CNID|nr:hypothetical protein OS493_012553 [Desmophyllum pertusum]